MSPERDTRCRIVDIAERFFREIGYQKTTVADIAKALRMSPANVYRFFESKKAINEAVAERLMAEVESTVAAIATEPRPAAERLRAILFATNRLNERLYVDNHRMHEMVAAAIEESWDVVQGHVCRFDAILQQVVRDGIEAGEFRRIDPRVASFCAKTAMMRFCHPQMIAQCAQVPGPTIEEMIDFVLAGLGAAPAVGRSA